MIKIFILIVFIFISAHGISGTHTVNIKNSAKNQVNFVRYDEFGNYKHYPIDPGSTITIPFEYDYLNIFALENDRDIPYFFFDRDEIEITEVKDNIYLFKCKNSQRTTELYLSETIFKFFRQKLAFANNTAALLEQVQFKLDSIFVVNQSNVSKKYKDLLKQFYLYNMLGEKIKYNLENKILEPFDAYWQQNFNHQLQSYILTFRNYTLSYLPKFIEKENLLQHYNHIFKGEYKEIAMYTIMHMAYYKNKEWFRNYFGVYKSLSKDNVFSEKLDFFKLTDELSNTSVEVTLINSNKDTISFKNLLTQLKGKVVLIDLWASWCVPCIKQIPFSNELANKFDTKPFKILYLSMDRELELFTAFSDEYLKEKLSYNIIGNFKSSFAILNKVSSIPRYLIINKKGIVVNDNAPLPDDAELKRLIEEYF